jgi:hypothetical protein
MILRLSCLGGKRRVSGRLTNLVSMVSLCVTAQLDLSIRYEMNFEKV